jgi:hypothetical protein
MSAVSQERDPERRDHEADGGHEEGGDAEDAEGDEPDQESDQDGCVTGVSIATGVHDPEAEITRAAGRFLLARGGARKLARRRRRAPPGSAGQTLI